MDATSQLSHDDGMTSPSARRTLSGTIGRATERTVAVAAMLAIGLMAGVFFAFNALVMPGFDATNPVVALPALQSINDGLDGQPFRLAFFGAALLAAVAVAVGAVRRDGLGSYLAMAAGAIYLVGTLLITLLFSNPLNGDLNGYGLLDPSSLGRTERYIEDWSRWNAVRTGSALVAFVLFAAAVLLPRRRNSGTAPVTGRPATDQIGT